MKISIDKKKLIPCLLCADAPCSKACPNKLDPAKIIRSLKFSNYAGAFEKANFACKNCDAPCEKACLSNTKVKIKEIVTDCATYKEENNFEFKRADISTNICGIKVENPFLLSSSVVGSNYDMVKRAFEAGWAGVAFKTICLMDIHEASPRFSALKNDDGTFQSFKNIEQLSDHSLVENLNIFRKLKEEFPNKFLLVSIMGRNDEEWEHLAKASEEAGADALELNFSCPNMMEENTGSDVGQVPELVERFTKVVKNAVKIPVLAKLTPNVASMLPAAKAAKNGGADGIAAINTIKSIIDLNLVEKIYDNKELPKISTGGLSGPAVKPIALKFIAELGKDPELEGMHISAMGGIETYEDAIMFMLLGAESIQITTAVMEYGYRIIEDLTDGLSLFLGHLGIDLLSSIERKALQNVVDVNDIERDIVIYPKFLRNKCLHCGRCYISCSDGGHQAIKFDENRMPILDPKKCVGCHLCVLVCPNNAIVSSEIKTKKI